MRNADGTFVRKWHEPWTPDKWDASYTDNRGRFRVYRPDYPRAYSEGYALRYHVVWWLKTGEPHPKGTELHHIDGIKTNDSFENLKPVSNSEHQLIHKSTIVTCEKCGNEFYRARHRLRYKHNYCSQKCYRS